MKNLDTLINYTEIPNKSANNVKHLRKNPELTKMSNILSIGSLYDILPSGTLSIQVNSSKYVNDWDVSYYINDILASKIVVISAFGASITHFFWDAIEYMPKNTFIDEINYIFNLLPNELDDINEAYNMNIIRIIRIA